jgi:hypothetical protein
MIICTRGDGWTHRMAALIECQLMQRGTQAQAKDRWRGPQQVQDGYRQKELLLTYAIWYSKFLRK